MAPANQDAGKNLIKLFWKMAGFEVLDLGKGIKFEGWLERIRKGTVQVFGVSCLTSACLLNLRTLLQTAKAEGLRPTIIIGGIAVNKAIAYDLWRQRRTRPAPSNFP